MLGADSTASMMVPGGGFHYLNHNQKVFEVGQDSALGIVTWGLASLGNLSHRTQIALFGDDLRKQPNVTVDRAAQIWIDRFWPAYNQAAAQEIARVKALDAKPPFDPANPGLAGSRTEDEEKLYVQLKLGLVVGFCVGGYSRANRIPCAFEIIFDPLSGKPNPSPIATGDTRCWGAPKVFRRMIFGVDPDLQAEILNSGFWSGSATDLQALLAKHQLYVPHLPMRDAIDFVHSCIASTIKTLKFSHLSQTCGGPIEIAVITSDREFRWVRHKEWDVAINEGNPLWKM